MRVTVAPPLRPGRPGRRRSWGDSTRDPCRAGSVRRTPAHPATPTQARRARYMKELDLPEYDAMVLTLTKEMSDFFDATIENGADAKLASNWLMGETMRLCKEKNVDCDQIKISPYYFEQFLDMVEKKEISGSVAKQVFEEMFLTDCDPQNYVTEKELRNTYDESELQSVIIKVIKNNTKCVEEYRGGKQKAIGALVGMAMKEMAGKADPVIIRKMLEKSI